MELYRELLSRSCLSVISAEPDSELDRIGRIITPSVRIEGRAELEVLFRQLLEVSDSAALIAPKTLDLVGHSTTSTSLLRLGDWVIDAATPTVTELFRELADQDVLPRLGIRAIRLLGCNTAGTVQGRSTICTLADVLGIEVYGTNHLLYDVHYDDQGFREAWEFLLVRASGLRRAASDSGIGPEDSPWPRALDIDALPALTLAHRAAGLPLRVATANAARQLLRLVRRDAGARMPGPLAAATCEVALPSATLGAYHFAHVLRDGAFVRFHPDGVAAPGVVYPVDDARLLRQIVDELPLSDIGR